ncbi:DUF370 domain-containing protein [Caldibacillus lycopersici]|uniref:DUF370 domain-containing protein n=1 Tax=Perspicuibacillus lycopersici TaxID=1325689 RepID=A0AAE3IU56_9BACI|nr:DUF370 domain-containing protein [Perspicuibacillus lycopersici]MCU9613491.1 DUF370 domain-containing protein [Perspicuibacillus lycopersici]
MYISIGENLVIRSSDIIAIIDKSAWDYNMEINHFSSNNLDNALLKRNYKSVIITNDNTFLSPFSPNTLKKRIQSY